MRLLLAFALLATPALAEEEDYAKLGPNALSITEDTAYLRANPAPDYWAFAAFTKPQFTTSACSIATVTAALNGLIGLPKMASETVLTQQSLLDLTGNAEWAALSAEGGDGVTFFQLADFTTQAIAATGAPLRAISWTPKNLSRDSAADLMRSMLRKNEESASDAILVYFNQGVVTGDWDGPHISLIGAYDESTDRVLILEVDQEWYIPYWTPAEVLLDAMLKPAPADQGVLEGETGGFVLVVPAT